MGLKQIVTRYKNCYFTGLLEDNKFIQMNLEPADGEVKVGNIYAGRVQNIVKNIHAAFVEFQKGQTGYLDLDAIQSPIYTKKQSKGPFPAMGDELLVQVTREAVKMKQPSLSADLNLTGEYSVLAAGRSYVGISAKVRNDAERSRLQRLTEPFLGEDYGFILRTSAAIASEEEIVRELQSHRRAYEEIKTRAPYCTAFTQIHRAEPVYLTELTASYGSRIEEIVTDCPEAAKTCRDYLIRNGHADTAVRLYEDKQLSLTRLYSVETAITKACHKQVWLDSGGFLVIEPTEALTVIDVNTGKAVKNGRNVQETFLKLNKEAAREAARQIRLRNLSGIIIIDFIDMESEAARQELLKEMDFLCRQDPVKTTVVDMTPLHLMEMTRKKIHKSFAEQLADCRD